MGNSGNHISNPSHFQQFKILCYKNILVSFRDWPILLTQTIIPLIILYVVYISEDLINKSETVNMNPLDVSINSYNEVFPNNKEIPVLSEDKILFNQTQFYFENSLPASHPANAQLNFLYHQEHQNYTYVDDNFSSDDLQDNEKLYSYKINNQNLYNPSYYNTNLTKLYIPSTYKQIDEKIVEIHQDKGFNLFDSHIQFGIGHAKNVVNKTSLKTQKNNIFAMFNSQHYHTTAGSLNLIANLEINMKNLGSFPTNSSSSSEFKLQPKITTINQPLKANATEKLTRGEIKSTGASFASAFATRLLFPLGYICSGMAIYAVKERVSKAKHVQQLTGLKIFIYWISFYAVDLVKCMLVMIPATFFIDVTDNNVFGWGYQYRYFYAYMILGCWALLPLVYIFSRFFAQPATTILALTLLTYVGGTVLAMTVVMLQMIDPANTSIPDGIHNVSIIVFPPYTFTSLVRNHYSNNESQILCQKNEMMETMCEMRKISWSEDYLAWHEPGVGRIIFILFWQGVYFFALLVSLDSWLGVVFKNLKRMYKSSVLELIFCNLSCILCFPCFLCCGKFKEVLEKNLHKILQKQKDM